MRVAQSAPGPYDDLPACPACGWDGDGGWEIGGYWICSICEWEDDPVQREHPDDPGGANGRSLRDWQAECADILGGESHPDWGPLDEIE